MISEKLKGKTMHSPGFWTSPRWTVTDAQAEEIIAYGLNPVRRINNDGSVIVLDSDGQRVARVDCQTKFKRGTGSQPECPIRDANARLIAAAPALLVACKYAFEVLTVLGLTPANVSNTISLLECAIDKAKGN